MAKSLINLLEETYVELADNESKFKALKLKLEQILTLYYEQNPPEFIDCLISSTSIKELLESGKFVTPLTKEVAKQLSQYVVIKCTARTPKGIKFEHVGAHQKRQWSASRFASGLNHTHFTTGECYIIFCTTTGRSHTWHWAKHLTEEFAVTVNNALKVPCKSIKMEEQ